MKIITSLNNETIKDIVRLQDSFYRKQNKKFIAQGYSVCMTLLKNGYKAEQIYVTQAFFEKYEKEFIDDVLNLLTIVSDVVMKKISTMVTINGILGVFYIPEINYELNSNSIVLYDIQDPGNMGTLIRSAAAMAVKNIFVIDGVDPYNPKVIQATAGTIAYVKIIEIDWKTFLQEHANIKKCALVVRNGLGSNKINLSESIFIIGNEGNGLPEDVINICEQKMTIEMPGKIESLNVAVAGSIAMYEKFLSMSNNLQNLVKERCNG